MGANEKELLATVTQEIVHELIKAQKEGRDVNLNRLKCQVSQKHGITCQPKLVDIIAAVPHDFKVILLFMLLNIYIFIFHNIFRIFSCLN